MSLKLQTILIRKFERRWSDLDTIVLLLIGTEPRTYAQLVDYTGASTSGVWNSLQRLQFIDYHLEQEIIDGRTLYKLTPKGRQELVKFLN